MMINEAVKSAGDVVAAGITIGVVAKLITAFAGILTIIWTAFRLWEMITGKVFAESKLAKWLTGRK